MSVLPDTARPRPTSVPAAPWPWQTLPSLRRSDVRFRRRLGAIAASLGSPDDGLLGPLTAMLGAPIEVTFQQVAFYEADDHTIRHLSAGWVGRVDLGPRDWTLVTMDPTTALAIADSVLDPGREARVLPRPLTRLEQTLLTALLAQAASLVPRGAIPLSVSLDPPEAQAELRLIAAASRTVVASYTLRHRHACGVARWMIPERTFDAIFDEARTPPTEALLARLGHVPLTATVVLGPLRVHPDELSQIEHGAVVLGPSLGRPQMPSASLHVNGSPLARGRWDRASDTLQLDPELPSPVSTGGLMNTAAHARLQVEVAVQIARWKTTLADLATLGPGQVLDLDLPLHAPVTLSIAEVDFARGELVDVEGSLGVRITELLTHTPPLSDVG